MSAKEPIPTPERTLDTVMFAEHYQFFVYDDSADPGELSIYWDQDSRDRMLLLGDRVVGIGTVRHLEVPISVEIYPKEPQGEPLDDFDHVVRCGIDLPSGRLVVSAVTEDIYEAQKVDVEPGTYGMRVYYGALSEVDEEGFEGEDFYKIAVWPTQSMPEYSVIKQWEDQPRFMY